MAKEEDKNKVQISCTNCDVSYWVKWDDEGYGIHNMSILWC